MCYLLRMKVAVASDIHLNHLSLNSANLFLREMIAQVELVLILGDTAEYEDLAVYVALIDKHCRHYGAEAIIGIGNHEPIGASLSDVRSLLSNLNRVYKHIHTSAPLTVYGDKTLVYLSNNYYDFCRGRAKKFMYLPEWSAVAEFRACTQDELINRIYGMAERSAEDLVRNITSQIEMEKGDVKRVLIGMHVPPFREASMFEGKISEGFAQAVFCHYGMGDRLRELAVTFPDIQFDVYAGHTHHKAVIKVLDNLMVTVSGSDYGKPVYEIVVV